MAHGSGGVRVILSKKTKGVPKTLTLGRNCIKRFEFWSDGMQSASESPARAR